MSVEFGPLIASDDYGTFPCLWNDGNAAEVHIGGKRNACNYTGRLVMQNLTRYGFFHLQPRVYWFPERFERNSWVNLSYFPFHFG